MDREHSLIFTGGDAPHARVLQHLPTDALIIAADSGYMHARALGMLPQFLVGDMDSIAPDQLHDARQRNVDIVEFSADKDFTDTELALALAEEHSSVSVSVVSGGGDRFDHVLAMAHSCVPYASRMSLQLFIGTARITFASSTRQHDISCALGDTVSLLPLGGDAMVTTHGLKWDLTNSALATFASRGVSNIATHTCVTITVTSGVVAIVQPFFLTTGDLS